MRTSAAVDLSATTPFPGRLFGLAGCAVVIQRVSDPKPENQSYPGAALHRSLPRDSPANVADRVSLKGLQSS